MVAGSFLGTGWSFPPTFARASASVVMVSGALDIRESLWVLLSTSKGERIMVPEYGCDIWLMVFRSVNTSFVTELRDYVAQAILDWEPRISVEAIGVRQDPDSVGIVWIEIDYVVRATNTRSNLVYPFYLREATLAGEG